MLKTAEVLGKTSAILHADGLKIYSDLVDLSKSGGSIDISFEGLNHCATAFLKCFIW